MSTIEPTDLLLVNRNQQSFYVKAEDAKVKILDDDLLLANRNGNSYKITGIDFRESIIPPVSIESPEILSPQDGAGLGDGTSNYLLTSEIIQVDEVSGDNGETWQWSQPATNGGITQLGRYVRSLGGRTVAFERQNGDLIYNDGIDLNVGWQINSSGAQLSNTGIILQGSGTLLATDGPDNSYVSTDGKNWTAITLDLPGSVPDNIQSGVYSTKEQRFYVMSQRNSGSKWTLWGSNVDGNLESPWEEVPNLYQYTASVDYSPSEVIRNGISYIMVAGRNNGTVILVENGKTISILNSPLSQVSNVSYSAEILVAGDSANNRIAFSTDFGQTWNDYAPPVTPYVIKAFQNSFILVSRDNDGTVMKSPDGENWTEYLTPASHSTAAGALEFSASGLVIAANYVNNVQSNGFLWSSLGYTDLTFQDNSNFDAFDVGTPTGLSDGSKTCEVLAIDATASTMQVLTADTFIANNGEQLVSAQAVTEVEVDPETLVFTATPYVDLEHTSIPGSAIWEVATSADFSSGLMTDTKPAVRSNNEILPDERVNIVLAEETEYWVRVTYTTFDSSISAQSAVSHFKTGLGTSVEAGWGTVYDLPASWNTSNITAVNLVRTCGDYFVAAKRGHGDGNAQYVYSQDGVDWTIVDWFDQSRELHGIGYGNGVYYAVSQDKIYTNTDITDESGWSESYTMVGNHSNSFSGIRYYSGKLFVVTNQNEIFYTENDGNSWSILTGDFIRDVMWNETASRWICPHDNSRTGSFIMIGVNIPATDTQRRGKPNGWSENSSGYALNGRVYYWQDKNIYVCVRNTEGQATWKGGNVDPNTGWEDAFQMTNPGIAGAMNAYSLDLGANELVIASVNGSITYSTDGKTWEPFYTISTDPVVTTNLVFGVAYKDGVYVAFSRGGKLLSSTTLETTTLFYNQETNSVISKAKLERQYGVSKASEKLGIFELTEKPNYTPAGFIREGTKYRPVRDYTQDLNTLMANVSEAQATLTELQSQ